MGDSHPVVVAYSRFLRLYERLETRLERELDLAYGRRLGPVLMVFHVQLTIHKWLVCQLYVTETEHLSPPDSCQGLHMLEVQNNLYSCISIQWNWWQQWDYRSKPWWYWSSQPRRP
jgi:hypothetical protein